MAFVFVIADNYYNFNPQIIFLSLYRNTFVPSEHKQEYKTRITLLKTCFDGKTYILRIISAQLPTRTIPHHTGIGPDEWFYSMVVVLVGSCPGGE